MIGGRRGDPIFVPAAQRALAPGDAAPIQEDGMSTQKVAQLFGIVFVLVGVLGFVPIAMIGGSMDMSTGMLLGLFPVNVLHNIVHVLFGVWGIMAAKSAEGATMYCKVGGVIYLALGILGFTTFIPGTLVPLGGYDTYLHLVLGAVLAYFGFAGAPARAAA
jgi:hypothetical protein